MGLASRRLDPIDDVQQCICDAASDGVRLDICFDNYPLLWIENIERSSGIPGAGASVLHALIEICDEHGLSIQGRITERPDILVPYYEELGFMVIPEEGRHIIDYH